MKTLTGMCLVLALCTGPVWSQEQQKNYCRDPAVLADWDERMARHPHDIPLNTFLRTAPLLDTHPNRSSRYPMADQDLLDGGARHPERSPKRIQPDSPLLIAANDLGFLAGRQLALAGRSPGPPRNAMPLQDTLHGERRHAERCAHRLHADPFTLIAAHNRGLLASGELQLTSLHVRIPPGANGNGMALQCAPHGRPGTAQCGGNPFGRPLPLIEAHGELFLLGAQDSPGFTRRAGRDAVAPQRAIHDSPTDPIEASQQRARVAMLIPSDQLRFLLRGEWGRHPRSVPFC